MRQPRRAFYAVENYDKDTGRGSVRRVFMDLDTEQARRRARRYCDVYERITERPIRLIAVLLAPIHITDAD